MAQPPSEPKKSLRSRQRPLSPRTGFWIITGLTVFLVLVGFGVAVFVILKSLSHAGHSVQIKPDGPSTRIAPVQLYSPTAAPAVTPIFPAAVSTPVPANESPSGTSSPGATTGEDRVTRQEVLTRVDLMPTLSQKDKDQLYAQVERARGFLKIAVVPFQNGKNSLGSAQSAELLKRLQSADCQSLLEDPTVVFVMVGYADLNGDEKKNLEISRSRAESVEEFLKHRLNLKNITHAVGLGGQNLFDKTVREKNRVVEIWAVQP